MNENLKELAESIRESRRLDGLLGMTLIAGDTVNAIIRYIEAESHQVFKDEATFYVLTGVEEDEFD